MRGLHRPIHVPGPARPRPCSDIPRDLEEIAAVTGLPLAEVEAVLAELAARGSVASRDVDVH